MGEFLFAAKSELTILVNTEIVFQLSFQKKTTTIIAWFSRRQ
ncbi:MAG: hypothetical protein ACKO11_04565 [Cuspidothrix sp.]